jgi:nucleoside-diphosphate-sugar epimerase
VSRALGEAGHTVVSLDALTRRSAFPQGGESPADDPPNLDWVLHFGAKTSIPESLDHPFATYANNIGSTLRALQVAQGARAAFLFMSSYVYGPPRYLPIDEAHPVASVNPYMGSKIIGEELCRQICHTAGLPWIILRGFNIFGDQPVPGRLIPDLLDALRRGTPIILNDPVPLRDYLYIEDFITLILKIILQQPIMTGVYNVGYGQSYSNREVAELVQGLSGGECPLVIQSRPRPHDILDCSVNTDLVKRTFSWQPAYPLSRALAELIARLHKEKKGAADA